MSHIVGPILLTANDETPMARPRKAPVTLAGGTSTETPAPPKDPPPKRPLPSVPVANPQSPDPISAVIVGGLDPDTVLARVRQPDGAISYVGAVRAGRPIDNLRFRLSPAQRISDEQYRAAEVYLALFSGCQHVGSNTQTIVNNAVYYIDPEPHEIEMRALGRMMATHEAARPVKQDELERVAAVWRFARVSSLLTREYRSILNDLIINELGVGAIARRWGVSPDAMGLSVRFALANLQRILAEVDAEYRAWETSVRETVREN